MYKIAIGYCDINPKFHEMSSPTGTLILVQQRSRLDAVGQK